MKKINTLIMTLLIISNAYFMYNTYYLKKEVLSYKENIKINKNNMLSMMLETDANSKTYIQSTDNKWPTNGYVFNEQMSKCEQGSKLKWDDANKKVIMEGNVSDKCYVFFDKYNPIKINSYTITPNGNKISISISATSGTGTITKYFYSKDDGASYVESTSNTYTFTNLAKGTYKIKAYVLDSNNKISEVISKNIEITSMSLSEYIMSQYTGTQGENGIYYHDANLTNGAGDNSYRYAGASDQVNNYVCFGSNVTPCPADNLYRIIGVFGDRVKLIKSDYATSTLLGNDGDYKQAYTATSYSSSNYKGNNLANIAGYTWNYKNNTTINGGYGSNTWSTSLLNKTNLNKNFITNIGADWAAKIAETTWKVGGNTWANIGTQPAKTAYQNEIVNPVTTNSQDSKTEYSAKIGLMYVSDYMYAAPQNKWTLVGYNSDASKDYRAAISVNWMYMGLIEWTISRNADYSNDAFLVNNTGGVYSSYVGYGAYGVRPVFNLSSSVKFSLGDGTSSNPIRLEL